MMGRSSLRLGGFAGDLAFLEPAAHTSMPLSLSPRRRVRKERTCGTSRSRPGCFSLWSLRLCGISSFLGKRRFWKLTSSNGTAGANVRAGFGRYLQEKFSTVDCLNKLRGLVYRGQSLHDWSEVPPRGGILNPGWKLGWDRYQDSLTTNFLAWQYSLLRECVRPDQFISREPAATQKWRRKLNSP